MKISILMAFIVTSLLVSSNAFAFNTDRENISHFRCPEGETNVIDMSRDSYNRYMIRHYCGEPGEIVDYGTEEHFIEKKVFTTGGGISSGTIEPGAEYKEWVYDWDSRRYIYFLLFKDMELIRIQRLDKEAF